MENTAALNAKNEKHVKSAEFIFYLVAVFFYTNMTGMVGNFRYNYFVDVLHLANKQVSVFNFTTSIIVFILNFLISMYIDGRKMGKNGKFRPLALLAAIPCGVFLMLSFWAPKGLTGTLLMIYVITVGIGWSVSTMFGNTVNMVANVMTPNLSERDNVLSFRSIASAVGNSTPLVIVVVLAIFFKDDLGMQYIISAALCGVIGIITMLFGIKIIRERVNYTVEKRNPLIGIKDVVTNKYAWVIIISEFLKSFRVIATSVGTFLCAAILGSASKFLFFGLPTGIGTAVGMLVINFLLKKFNSKILYIASGIYSVIANVLAFLVGYAYFKHNSGALQIVFIIFLFLIGLQFGASNLLPSMFQADVLEDIELKTGKRLDATLPFVIGIGTLISGTIGNTISPLLLYGDSSIIQYVQATDAIPNPEQSLRTKVLLLFFYTVIHGIMMFLAGVPFFFYKLTGKTKDDIHEELLKMREERESASE